MLVRSRELLLLLFGSIVVSIVATILLAGGAGETAEVWRWVVLSHLFLGLVASGLVALSRRWSVDLAAVIGPFPDRRRFAWAASAGVPMLLSSFGMFYLVYLPISYAAPAVALWALESEGVLIATDAGFPLLPNLLMFLDVVAWTPIVEELFFRGFLLRRLARLWGASVGIVVSAAVFGIFHTDFLGAFLFAAVASVLYLKTGRLWLPIVMHAAVNLLVWLLEMIYFLLPDAEAAVTLDEFQRQWWVGLLGLVLGLPWALRVLRKNWPRVERVPPVTSELS